LYTKTRVKNIGKKIVLAILSWQTRRLQRAWKPKVVAVVGSYGKTSTKFAVASALKRKFRVRFQEGNYNDIVTIPLVLFGESLPSLLNPVAWTLLFVRNEMQLRKPAPYDVAVVELGTDGPGQIAAFKRYLHADIAVVTSIAYEHMEFFDGLGQVAEEELSVRKLSDKLFVNADLCDYEYYKHVRNPLDTYAMDSKATYTLDSIAHKDRAFMFTVKRDGVKLFDARMEGIARVQLYSALAVTAVASDLGMSAEETVEGLAAIGPVAGRMQQLKGIRDSLILDETYNSSPEATKAALDTLYELEAPQKIALLGNMNELGDYSAEAHRDVGDYCDPKKLDLVVTIGEHANRVLAPAARARGCTVEVCQSPYEAGEYLKEHVKKGAVVLAKGSQNGVYAEEAIKYILNDPEDAKLLVRQSKHWLAIKRRRFQKNAR